MQTIPLSGKSEGEAMTRPSRARIVGCICGLVAIYIGLLFVLGMEPGEFWRMP